MSDLPSYKYNDPRGWGGDPSRGASLGRASIQRKDNGYDGFAVLRKVRMSADKDYDLLGTYWGHMEGLHVWWCATKDYEIDFCVRATSRKSAEDEVRKHYPNIRFYKHES